MAGQPFDTSAAVWLGGLPDGLTEQDVQAIGEAAMVGTLVDVWKNPSGPTGRLQYSSREEALAAIEALNGADLGGVAIQADVWTETPKGKGKGKLGGSIPWSKGKGSMVMNPMFNKMLQSMMRCMLGGGGSPSGKGKGKDGTWVKKKLCVNFPGNCNFGDRCSFAHGEHEIGEPIPGKGGGNGGGDAAWAPAAAALAPAKPVSLMELALAGQAKVKGKGKASSWAPVADYGSSWAPAGKGKGKPTIKTKLCMNYPGICYFGDSCSFAHGELEIGMPIPQKGGGGGPEAWCSSTITSWAPAPVIESCSKGSEPIGFMVPLSET